MFDYNEILSVKKVYNQGGNVADFLRSEHQLIDNTSDIIEIAYDLQAGSYIKNMQLNKGNFEKIIHEMLLHLTPCFESCESVLDIGTGEMTTLSMLISKAKSTPPNKIFALDISWSRLSKGLEYFRSNCPIAPSKSLNAFVADMKAIPLPSKSVDLIISSHALEPNGNEMDLENILSELFRVTKKKLVLFEPSYELNSIEGKKRMERLGYIKNLKSSVEKLGGVVESTDLLNFCVNPLNPTACYVVTPPDCFFNANTVLENNGCSNYSAPASDFILQRMDNFLFSPELGLAYPILKDIPILRRCHGVLATGLEIDNNVC